MIERTTMEEVREQLKPLKPKGKDKKEIYHFHKDCKHYSKCVEEEVFQGKSKRIRFTCPMLRHPILYFPSDIHTIKWECNKFETYQEELKFLEEPQ